MKLDQVRKVCHLVFWQSKQLCSSLNFLPLTIVVNIYHLELVPPKCDPTQQVTCCKNLQASLQYYSFLKLKYSIFFFYFLFEGKRSLYLFLFLLLGIIINNFPVSRSNFSWSTAKSRHCFFSLLISFLCDSKLAKDKMMWKKRR